MFQITFQKQVLSNIFCRSQTAARRKTTFSPAFATRTGEIRFNCKSMLIVVISRRAKISIGRKIMRRCNQSREKAATSVGPVISKTADERWNLCPFDCKSLICRQSVKSLLTPTEGPLLANIIIYQIVDFWENWREI